MTIEYSELDDFLKRKIDDLFLLEVRADERADKLSVVTHEIQSANEAKMSEFIETMQDKMQDMKSVTDKINEASETVEGYMAACSGHAKTAFWLFLVSFTLSVLMLVGTIFYSQHIHRSLSEAKAELDEANTALHDKPLFLTSDGSIDRKNGEYVRIIPESQTTLRNTSTGKSYSGVYAEVWHKEDK